MKIVHVTTVHSRNDIRIFHKECMTLFSGGHNVSLVVADGEGDRVEAGIDIRDIGRRSRYRLTRMLREPRAAAAAIRRLGPDVVHAHDPELLPVLLRLAREGVHAIYDAHEDVPRQILSKHWVPSLLRGTTSRAFEWYEDWVTRRLDVVVAATQAIANRFQRNGVRSVAINNYPLLAEYGPGSTGEAGLQKRRQVCYVGGITRIRGVKQLIDALPLVPGVRLALCGAFGEPGLESACRSSAGWEQVDYHGHVDREVAKSIMHASVAGVVTFEPVPNHLDAQPNKLFEYMAAGLPVIASNFPLWVDLIEVGGFGLCVDPMDPRSIAMAIERLASDPDYAASLGEAGLRAVQHRFNWEAEGGKLLDVYGELK